MRLVALGVAIAALAFAGCAAPLEEEDDPLVGLCPAWLAGPGEQAVTADVPRGEPKSSQAQPPGDGNASFTLQGHPLDLYRVRITALQVPQGLLELRAFAGEGQLLIRDYREERAQLKPVVVLDGADDVGQEFDALLTPISENADPAPSAVRLEWRQEGGPDPLATAHVEATVTFHYRICGA